MKIIYQSVDKETQEMAFETNQKRTDELAYVIRELREHFQKLTEEK